MRVLLSFDSDATPAITAREMVDSWVVDSAVNREIAQRHWSRPSTPTLSLFDPQTLADILPTVLEHHPNCAELELHGLTMTYTHRAILRDFGFTVSSTGTNAYLAVKHGTAV